MMSIPTRGRPRLTTHTVSQYVACCYGGCKSSSRRLEPGVRLIQFPKPCVDYRGDSPHEIEHCDKCSTCFRWMELCKRRGKKFKTLTQICKFRTYVCSKHFMKEEGPTTDFPDPLPATYTANQLKKARQTCRAPKTTVERNCLDEFLPPNGVEPTPALLNDAQPISSSAPSVKEEPIPSLLDDDGDVQPPASSAPANNTGPALHLLYLREMTSPLLDISEPTSPLLYINEPSSPLRFINEPASPLLNNTESASAAMHVLGSYLMKLGYAVKASEDCVSVYLVKPPVVQVTFVVEANLYVRIKVLDTEIPESHKFWRENQNRLQNFEDVRNVILALMSNWKVCACFCNAVHARRFHDDGNSLVHGDFQVDAKHRACNLLCRSTRCFECRRIVAAAASAAHGRKKRASRPGIKTSSRTNFRYLTFKELMDRLKKTRAELSNERKKVNRLQERVRALLSNKSVC